MQEKPETEEDSERQQSSSSSSSSSRKKHILGLLREAAAKACAEGDPWAKYKLEDCTAERIERHLYDPVTEQWHTDETIVKMQSEPFTNGAMRFCYRLKKRAQPPQTATNHRFHKTGWKTACNYIAKAYHKNNCNEIDCSEEAKEAVRKDIILQYEANRWADSYNDADPPAKIHFIRAYAISFPDRPGEPWFALERYISGHDRYGATFVKHNTNAGFVDKDLRRLTPQVFSAYSFYASHGTRLVADIQGVGDLYTDPQVLSSNYRFGDGDLGPRGMALFFKSFRHCSMSDALGIPIFPLSRHELQVQVKYEEDEETLSHSDSITEGSEPPMNFFQRLDMNRLHRRDPLNSPMDLMQCPTERRSNLHSREVVSKSVRESLQANHPRSLISSPPSKLIHNLHRTKSDVNEVQHCLDRARRDQQYTYRDYHRKSSGQLRERHYKRLDSGAFRKGAATIVRKLCNPMLPTNTTRENLGKVHFQMAVLHGMGRFPDVEAAARLGHEGEDEVNHDAFSVLFHLSYGAAQRNAPSCLALARVQAGLTTTVSSLLQSIVSVDFDAAKELLERAMHSPYGPIGPKASAACLLYQILHDERSVDYDTTVIPCNGEDYEQKSEQALPFVVPDDQKNAAVETAKVPDLVINDEIEMVDVLVHAISLLNEMETETAKSKAHRDRVDEGNFTIQPSDRVEANYCLEGSFYPGSVAEISEDGKLVTVCYDDDGSSEQLPRSEVRLVIPPTATQTNLGGPLSDEEAFGQAHRGDDKFLLCKYQLQAELAEHYAATGIYAPASSLLEEASEGALNDGKMKLAAQWSLRAAEFQNP